MTHEQMEEIKRRQLDALMNPKPGNAVFKASVTDKGAEFEFQGSLVGIVTTAFSGLHELEKKIPGAAKVIDTAFEGYKLFRSMEKGDNL